METRIEREKRFHDKAYAEQPRQVVGKYYSITESSIAHYKRFLKEHSSGKRVLEYGCGEGSYAFFLANQNANVTGIDISDYAIKEAEQRSKREGLNICFRAMNAEKLEFNDNTFDVVCGTGILHHLELKTALTELSRVLTPQGQAIFIEPLGHNPFINLYRKATPNLRTEDEHPLLMMDIELLREYFSLVDVRYSNLFSLAAVPFHSTRIFRWAVGTLELLDKFVFKLLPFMRKYAWTVVIIVSQPNK